MLFSTPRENERVSYAAFTHRLKMTNIAGRRSALIALLILSLVWGANWIVMKTVLAYIGPITFSAIRYVAGTMVLFLFLIVSRESLAPTPWKPTLLIGLTQTAGFQAFVQLSLITGGAGKMALIAYTMPFWVIPFAWVLLRDKPNGRQWACIVLAAAGLICILEPWRVQPALISSLIALAAGLCWAIGTVLSKQQFQKRPDIPFMRWVTWQMAYGSVVLVAAALCVHERATDWSPALYASLAYNAVMSTGLAWALWLFAVQRLPANVAGLGSLFTPLVSVLLAWLLLGEMPDTAEFIGIATIAIALIGVLRPAATAPSLPAR
jgi:drug/metabolite transporter (DMT)-like permease